MLSWQLCIRTAKFIMQLFSQDIQILKQMRGCTDRLQHGGHSSLLSAADIFLIFLEPPKRIQKNRSAIAEKCQYR